MNDGGVDRQSFQNGIAGDRLTQRVEQAISSHRAYRMTNVRRLVAAPRRLTLLRLVARLGLLGEGNNDCPDD